jgi:uncharacterized protein involved in exopolysaccharide biosynthesis
MNAFIQMFLRRLQAACRVGAFIDPPVAVQATSDAAGQAPDGRESGSIQREILTLRSHLHAVIASLGREVNAFRPTAPTSSTPQPIQRDEIEGGDPDLARGTRHRGMAWDSIE